jgi:hypothetical protein
MVVSIYRKNKNQFQTCVKRFTGHVATFSNSLVFVSPAIGLLKFNSTLEKATNPMAHKEGTEPDLEERGSTTAGQR